MKDSANVKWVKDLAFEAEVDGFRIQIDSKAETGSLKYGPRPKPLMMVALAGCTGMDVASLLKKMRIEVESFVVRVDGELTDEHPKHFTAMHLIYEFRGKDLPLDKIKRAVELSQDTYCGVSASYRKAMKLSYEIKIADQ
jgi:putative redox protein